VFSRILQGSSSNDTHVLLRWESYGFGVPSVRAARKSAEAFGSLLPALLDAQRLEAEAKKLVVPENHW
jgi:hypothetical protein